MDECVFNNLIFSNDPAMIKYVKCLLSSARFLIVDGKKGYAPVPMNIEEGQNDDLDKSDDDDYESDDSSEDSRETHECSVVTFDPDKKRHSTLKDIPYGSGNCAIMKIGNKVVVVRIDNKRSYLQVYNIDKNR